MPVLKRKGRSHRQGLIPWREKIQKEVKEQECFDNKQILLAELEEYGGAWNSENKIKDELRKLVGPMKLKALQLQVKARKVILSQSVPDPKILQQSTTIKGKYTQFGVTELQSNLAKAISFAEKSAEERATDVIEKLVLRPEDERKAQLEDAKNLIWEKAAKFQERDKDSAGEGTSKKKTPKLFGRRIRHKWDDGWHEATVTKVYDEDEYSTDCEFGVEYVGFPGEYEVNLIEDWKNNWVVVCGSANKKKLKRKNQQIRWKLKTGQNSLENE